MKFSHIVIPALALLASSCNNKGPREESDIVGQQLMTVSVSRQSQKAAPGMEMTDANGEEAIIIDSFDENSKLYFSQMGPASDPNFENKDDSTPYLYIYQYEEDENASWFEGYNFSLKDGRKAFDWESVKSVGSVGNAFSFYAFYFPVDNELRFNVETNQAGSKDPYDKSNFMKSDIMGAYHATSSLYTRMRFKLFHLMVYLKVTVYVPDYEDTPAEDNKPATASGFKAGAFKGAFVMNAYTDFSVEWRANRSSDTEAPLVQATTSGPKKNITMYRHEGDEDKIYDELPVKDYYTGHEIPKNVREYNFSVLFPAQTFGDDFLCFALESYDGSMKYYYFSGSPQLVGDNLNFSLTQGTLQQLYLYVPRKTNETILVGANILPWNNANTDMTVTQQQDADSGEGK